MPGCCLNAWQTDACDWSIELVWRSSDWIERAIFISLAFMLSYTFFFLIRFFRRYHVASVKSRALVTDSWRTFQRCQRTIVADLSRGSQTLKAVAYAAPFLGLAGTSYGILVTLFFGTLTGRELGPRPSSPHE